MNCYGTRRPRRRATMSVVQRQAWHAGRKEQIAHLRASRGSQAMMAARRDRVTGSARAMPKAAA